MNLWLDDYRTPPSLENSGRIWTWARNADEAIEYLKTGKVKFASLDHDLADEHYFAYEGPQDKENKGFREKTGYDVMLFMEEHGIWPEEGTRIHTMNMARKPVMLQVVRKIYGQVFQEQYVNCHIV